MRICAPLCHISNVRCYVINGNMNGQSINLITLMTSVYYSRLFVEIGRSEIQNENIITVSALNINIVTRKITVSALNINIVTRKITVSALNINIVTRKITVSALNINIGTRKITVSALNINMVT